MRLAYPILITAFGLATVAALALAQAPKPEVVVPPAKELPSSSPAAPTSPGAIIIQYKLEILDKDGDKRVSRAEAAGVPDLLKIFATLDRNRDGFLDAAELDEHNKRAALGAK